MITVLKKGLLTTVQDRGRYDFGKFGISPAGAMDPFAYRLGNVLVGNQADEASLECTLIGPSLRFEDDHVFAVTGAEFSPTLNGVPVEANRALRAKAGDILELQSARSGVRGYLSFSGGVEVPLVMGSRSTDIKGKFGGHFGRSLKDGDRLLIGEHDEIPNLPFRFVSRSFGVDYESGAPLRVLPGPQADYFTESGLRAFFTGQYTVLAENDRMGYRLSGELPQFRDGKTSNIISDGVAMGAIQVSEKLLVLTADRQTTGGYAKIGCVISVDLPRLAQKKAGDILRFERVGIEQAEAAYLDQANILRRLEEHLNHDDILFRSVVSVGFEGRTFRAEVSRIG